MASFLVAYWIEIEAKLIFMACAQEMQEVGPSSDGLLFELSLNFIDLCHISTNF